MSADSKNSKLSEYSGEDKVVSSYELDEIIKERQAVKPQFSIRSGIPTLDRKIGGGFRGGQLVLISGPTGQGKTTFLQTITKKFAEAGEFPLWFTYEMPPEDFFQCFPKLPFFFLPKMHVPYQWQWFADRCQENYVKNAGKVVMVDHLHFLIDFLRDKNPSIEISQIVRKIKSLARDNQWIVFLVAHVQKLPDGTKATINHIRDCGMTPQESDTVLMVQRTREGDGTQAVLTIEKCRVSGVMGHEVKIKKIDGYLREITKKEKYPV